VPATPSIQCKVQITDAANGADFAVSPGIFAIIDLALRVTAPNGGETWVTGSVQNIQWQTTGTIPTVNIDYSTDAGTTWNSVAAGYSNSGSYAWTVPAETSNTCRIRVKSGPSITYSDQSDANFTISAPSITVTAPNGGDSWIVGTTHAITWQTAGSVPTVRVDYSVDDGAMWVSVAAAISNTGTYSWVVPATRSATCRVRVSDAVDGVPQDLSDAAFAIGDEGMTVTSPNGGEWWLPGSSHNITWQSVGSIANVKIDLSADGGTSWQTLLASFPNSGSYNWTVPTLTSALCLVRVSDAADGVPADRSDSTFAIGNTAIIVTTPNGGEVWQPGETHNVTWRTIGSVPNVKIDYSADGGTSWVGVVSVFPNGGSYNWTIPTVSSVNCLVRISDAADGTPQDQSDSTFSVGATRIMARARVVPPPGEVRIMTNGVLGRISVELNLEKAGEVGAEVYCASGSVVRTLFSGSMQAGYHRLIWDGTNNSARALSGGLYVVRVSTPSGVSSRAVVLPAK
jgi:hypothetical protein